MLLLRVPLRQLLDKQLAIMSFFMKEGNIESICFSGHFWDEKNTITTAKKRLQVMGSQVSGPPKEICQEEMWRTICGEECLGDLINTLHAVYEDNKPGTDSPAVTPGMQTMQTLFNKNCVAIREEQGK